MYIITEVKVLSPQNSECIYVTNYNKELSPHEKYLFTQLLLPVVVSCRAIH